MGGHEREIRDSDQRINDEKELPPAPKESGNQLVSAFFRVQEKVVYCINASHHVYIMTRLFPLLTLSFIPLLVTGCAIGNHYDYQSVRVTLQPSSKKYTVSVVTVDHRPDVLKSSVQNNYVGMTRGGYGNPFRVYTKSGAPLSEDLSRAIVSSLNSSGYQATAITGSPVTDETSAKFQLLASSSDRRILVTVNKWESDTLINTDLTTDINIQVYDHSGKQLANECFSASKGLGGNFLDPVIHARASVLSETASILSQIFSSPRIHNSL